MWGKSSGDTLRWNAAARPKLAIIDALGAVSLSLGACGGGGEAADNAAENQSADVLPGQPVNAVDGADASGTTGSTTGDAGGPLNIAGDAQNDSAEANSTASNAH